MNWDIAFSKQAEKFLEKNTVSRKDIFELIRSALKKFKGEKVNIDVKKLKGEWEGFHRIRKGKARVIAEFRFDNFSVFVEVIDWRGEVYK